MNTFEGMSVYEGLKLIREIEKEVRADVIGASFVGDNEFFASVSARRATEDQNRLDVWFATAINGKQRTFTASIHTRELDHLGIHRSLDEFGPQALLSLFRKEFTEWLSGEILGEIKIKWVGAEDEQS